VIMAKKPQGKWSIWNYLLGSGWGQNGTSG
jgi:hypothetical protein